jgi:hypothetical protein
MTKKTKSNVYCCIGNFSLLLISQHSTIDTLDIQTLVSDLKATGFLKNLSHMHLNKI